ncbi:hypothetical protein C8J57DRAFT_1065777 [Mycena rebaudengoi]|nr:hypothetical protein C8J57DRAFT_1065777 [Mycena rebaudengoi]
MSSTKLLHVLADHDCTGCPETFTVLAPSERTDQQLRKHRAAINAKHRSKPRESRLKAAKLSAIAGKIKARVPSSSVIDSESKRVCFLPPPLSQTVEERIVRQACVDVVPDKFVEAGCCVCGQLTLLTDLQKKSHLADVDLNILHEDDVTRAERSAVDEPIVVLSGPVIDDTCDSVCKECTKAMHAGKRPLKSLTNRLWIGRVPWQLKDLSFAERMLIARVRHNRCVVRVNSGRGKLSVNAIMFANPTVQVYNILPPSSDEISGGGGGGGDILYSRGPQAEQRVYGRQACSTCSAVWVVILTDIYKMPTEHHTIPGGQSYKTLANCELAGQSLAGHPVRTSWDLTTSTKYECTGGVLSSQV